MTTGHVEVVDGTAVAGDDAVEAPVIAQYVLFVARVAAAGVTVYALVGAHHLAHVGLLHQGLEGGQVGLPEVALGQLLDVELVAVPLRAAVHGEVLGTGQQLQVAIAVGQGSAVELHALQTAHHGDAHAAGQPRVFAVGLLSASPAWVTEDVDVGRPKGKSLVAAYLAAPLGLIVFGACLVAGSGKAAIDQGIVPRGGQGGGDGEHGGEAVTANAV